LRPGRPPGRRRPPPRLREEVFQRSLFFERERIEEFARAVPPTQPALIEWGGFYVPSYTFYDDIDGGHAHMTWQDFRLWTQIRVDEVHRVFARMQMQYIDFAAGDAHGFPGHDLIGPDLEIGYYELDVSGAAKKYCGQEWPVQVLGRGGRQWVEVGRGIALGEILDVGLFIVEAKDFVFRGFAGRNVESTDNIDLSVPGFSRSRRNVYGGEFIYTGLDRHQPYTFFVIQRDWSEERPVDPFQDYRYNSQYYGVGSRGALSADLRYSLESIWEFGHSAARGQQDDSEGIHAYAFDGELDYYAPHPLKPVGMLEYAYASGDGDRRSATTAVNGNTPGTNDTAFQGFGYVNSGLALAARFTNLQFVRLGGRLTPYENKVRLGRIDVGLDYYFLWKTDRHGPISDFRADRTSPDIGQEVDVFLEWRIFSDLAWTIRYARFFPGRAYSDDEPRDYLYTGLNFSF